MFQCIVHSMYWTHKLLHHDKVAAQVGAPPIKQHAYRVIPDKHLCLQKQVTYLLENGLAEHSSWRSRCLLVQNRSEPSDFTADLCKVKGVTKPDCYPLPQVDDCVDGIGGTKYVMKLNLLNMAPLTPRTKEV